MDILLKNNVVFTTYQETKILKEKILEFIFESKTDKILYKGNPIDINYKLLKKILPIKEIKTNQSKNSINKIIEIYDTDSVRDVYERFLKKIKTKHCLIYKV